MAEADGDFLLDVDLAGEDGGLLGLGLGGRDFVLELLGIFVLDELVGLETLDGVDLVFLAP